MNLTGDEVTTDEVEKIVIYASGAFITLRLNWSLIFAHQKESRAKPPPSPKLEFQALFRRPILSNALRADEGLPSLGATDRWQGGIQASS